jgi:hypothetical protein
MFHSGILRIDIIFFALQMNVVIRPSKKLDKKMDAVFPDGKVISFGAKGYSDFTIHKDP